MKLTIRVNEMVQVRLTEAGRKVWLDYQLSTNPAAVAASSEVVCVPLWELMQAFGSELKLSLKRGPLFKDEEVELKW